MKRWMIPNRKDDFGLHVAIERDSFMDEIGYGGCTEVMPVSEHELIVDKLKKEVKLNSDAACEVALTTFDQSFEIIKLKETLAKQDSLIKLLQASECQPFDAYYKTCEVHYGLLQEDFKKQVEENELLKNKNAALIEELIEPVSGNSYKELYVYANAFATELQDKNDKLEKEAKVATCTSPMLCFFKRFKKV
mgnify:CR=1 FL=1